MTSIGLMRTKICVLLLLIAKRRPPVNPPNFCQENFSASILVVKMEKSVDTQSDKLQSKINPTPAPNERGQKEKETKEKEEGNALLVVSFPIFFMILLKLTFEPTMCVCVFVCFCC